MTLVELLIVMAIVAAVAAVAMPVFARARGFAQRSVCAGNMRQAALAVSLYADDFDESYPSFLATSYGAVYHDDYTDMHHYFCRGGLGRAPVAAWSSLVTAYVGGGSDPSDSGSKVAKTFRCPADNDWDTHSISFEYKMWLATGQTKASVPTPSRMVMLWEEWAYHNGMENENDRRAEMNVVFADGHTKWLRLSDTTSARYGTVGSDGKPVTTGPDMHWLFPGNGEVEAGADVIN
jgi:prepilin-type processing-associated H-X9-DG protein